MYTDGKGMLTFSQTVEDVRTRRQFPVTIREEEWMRAVRERKPPQVDHHLALDHIARKVEAL